MSTVNLNRVFCVFVWARTEVNTFQIDCKVDEEWQSDISSILLSMQ